MLPASRDPAGRLGLASLVSLVIANMIGAGVFTTSGFALADLGSGNRVMLAWATGAVLALCGAASYAGLVRRICESGGEYVFLARAVHPLAGFLAGWVSLLAGFTGAIAFAALAFAAYAAPLLPGVPSGLVASGVILAAAGLHGLRVQTGALAQNAAVAVKLVLIGGFVATALALGAPPPRATPPDLPPFSAADFASTLVWISLSYSGFNAAVYVAGEAQEPRLNAPRALMIGTVLVSVVYLALNAVFVYLPPFAAVAGREDVAAAAALAIGGAPLAMAVRTIIALALLTSVFSMVMAGPRVYARMADDGLLPRALRFRGDVPRPAIALQAALAIAVVQLATLRQLLTYLGLTLSVSAAATVGTLFLLRSRYGADAVPVAGYPLTPALFIGATLAFAALAALRNPIELLAAGATFASGALAYALLRHASRGAAR
jgi:APA family basic amino acid/polyamine antiporter